MVQNSKHFLLTFTSLLLILNIRNSCGGSVKMQSQTDFFYNNVPKEKLENAQVPNNQILTVRLTSNTLLKYTSYKDVSILHFRIPPDTRTAFFVFKAFEEPKSAFQRQCKPKDVTLYLKASSYPVISPENITFPKNFLSPEQRLQTYNLQFKSNETKQHITVEGPEVGNWFAVAFVSWTDPNKDRIEQQGLVASCDTLLSAEMSVTSFRPFIINNGQEHSANLTNNCEEPQQQQQNVTTEGWNETPIDIFAKPKFTNESKNSTNIETIAAKEIIYKFYVPPDIGLATVHILFKEICSHCPDVSISIQANAYPYIEGLDSNRNFYVYDSIIKPNQTDDISLDFYVQPKTWHYVKLKFANSPEEFLNKSIVEELKQRSIKITKAQKIICYQLQYTFRIDYQIELVEKHDATSAKNYSRNKAKNVHTSNLAYRFRDMNFYPLLRQTYREFFMFDYDLMPDENGTVPALLNLTAGTPSGFTFNVGEVYDIGGTLSFVLSIKSDLKPSNDLKAMSTLPSLQERSGILAEKLIGSVAKSETESPQPNKKLTRSNQTIIVCMHLREPGVPIWPDKCRYGYRLMSASSIVNNTDSSTNTGLTHVPFPESGQWYITMGLYCHGTETAKVTIIDNVKDFVHNHITMLSNMSTPCACASNASRLAICVNDRDCLATMGEAETLKIKECMMDAKCTTNYDEMTRLFEIHHKAATEQQFAVENCNASVMFTVSSSPCVGGRCGRFGRCYHYMSGGFVFSTCVCMKGYRGWDCTEDSQVPSRMSILFASLFLTLSNLLFFPSVYLALRRNYYTEAVIYFFAMFFSIFYHACDSGEDEYGFCLVKIGVLQFCDFYCGLLAIWATLVAMANFRSHFVSILHMVGAILLAFGTELDKQSLWVFLAPALTGICLISISWGLRCYKTQKWYPARRYLTIYMPLGAVLVMVGLVCYAFLQTRQNYHIVHSVWHLVMAVSILCLLPSSKSFTPTC